VCPTAPHLTGMGQKTANIDIWGKPACGAENQMRPSVVTKVIFDS
jgi:hypothetical protein